jgi:hypothetical protein
MTKKVNTRNVVRAIELIYERIYKRNFENDMEMIWCKCDNPEGTVWLIAFLYEFAGRYEDVSYRVDIEELTVELYPYWGERTWL